MKMNLSKLFELQRQLDEHIEREHSPKDGENRFEKKILALQVELGELANEWRGFKFWSHDQEPRTEMYKFSPLHNEPLIVKTNPLLEEYVDCLHFILSIGLELGMDEIADELDLKKIDFLASNTILSCFIDLSYDIADFYYQRKDDDIAPYLYKYILLEFSKLGEMLGFTWEQIEQAYMEKIELILKLNDVAK